MTRPGSLNSFQYVCDKLFWLIWNNNICSQLLWVWKQKEYAHFICAHIFTCIYSCLSMWIFLLACTTYFSNCILMLAFGLIIQANMTPHLCKCDLCYHFKAAGKITGLTQMHLYDQLGGVISVLHRASN